MPRGICKLCLKEKDLRASHFMPRGLYPYLTADQYEPVLVSTHLVMPTSRQTKDYVLCADCEQLLNKEGETWLLPKLATIDGTFPLYDMLREVEPGFEDKNTAVYPTATNPKIERDHLIHFAIGLFWKASVHPWRGDGTEARIDLGTNGDDLRRFLLGESSIPENLALVMFVVPPPVNLIAFTEPLRGSNLEFANYHCYVPGIFMNLCVGERVRQSMAATCIISNPIGPVVVQDVTPDIRALLHSFASTANKAAKLYADQAEITAKGLNAKFRR